MDPLDIVMNQEQVIPYYQPVISADTQLVIGYEVSAYFQGQDGETQNLSWFFGNDSIPDEFQLELNTSIQQKVLDAYLKTDQSVLLFFKYDARLMSRDNGETLISLLESYAETGLDLSKIIIELKEELITDETDRLRPIFMFLKSAGIRIAFDDVGQKNGNLDRLALLKPNIVKLDAGFLKDDLLPHLYRDVHHSLYMLSRKIGATLMFKGVSTFNQLNYAWRNGAQYYQGSYLKRAEPEFIAADYCKEQVMKDFQHFVTFERKKMHAQLALMNEINQQFEDTLKQINLNDSYDHIISKVGEDCRRFAFRVYICNEEGLQLSSNAALNSSGEWELHEEGQNKNWSWRPYFFENIVRMNLEKKGILSDLYTDIERDEQIRTFSYPISDALYLFLDVPYDYLYEQEWLL